MFVADGAPFVASAQRDATPSPQNPRDLSHSASPFSIISASTCSIALSECTSYRCALQPSCWSIRYLHAAASDPPDERPEHLQGDNVVVLAQDAPHQATVRSSVEG